MDRNLIAGPASLLAAGATGARERSRARDHFLPVRKEGSFDFRAYKGEDVRHTLEALFHGKCAYCECRYDVGAPVDIEHFRPKNEVEDAAGARRAGYWFFAAEWTNLLPSCIDCNRRRFQPTPVSFASLRAGLERSREAAFVSMKTGKEACFPIGDSGVRIEAEPSTDALEKEIAAERALLLDPCRDNPGEHLRFHIDRNEPLGIIYPVGSDEIVLPVPLHTTNAVAESERLARDAGVSVKGSVSIVVYGLNRLALVQERTKLLRQLEFLGALVIDLASVSDLLSTIPVRSEKGRTNRDRAIERTCAASVRIIAEIRKLAAPEAPFSEMVRAWIAEFRKDFVIESSSQTGLSARK